MAKQSNRTHIRELAREKVQYYTATLAISAKAGVHQCIDNQKLVGWWVDARVYVGASELAEYNEED